MPVFRRTQTDALDSTAIRFRCASLADAAGMRKLVVGTGVLEANSCYCYLLLCRDFAETCIVATCHHEIVGFVAAYRPPTRLDTVFVWQIGVAWTARRQGLAKRLLQTLISSPACRDIRYLEATVAPSNAASRQLFRSLAKDRDVPCYFESGFAAELFGGEDHEEEELLRIGPFS